MTTLNERFFVLFCFSDEAMCVPTNGTAGAWVCPDTLTEVAQFLLVPDSFRERGLGGPVQPVGPESAETPVETAAETAAAGLLRCRRRFRETA